MLTLGLAAIAAWVANLLYANYSRTRVTRAEFRLILRRCWIPGYLVYHDGLFAMAEIAQPIPVVLIHERVVWEMVRQMSSSRDPWRVVGPQRSGYFPPLSLLDDSGWQPLVGIFLSVLLIPLIHAMWQALAVVAMFDKRNFVRKHARIPTFYPW